MRVWDKSGSIKAKVVLADYNPNLTKAELINKGYKIWGNAFCLPNYIEQFNATMFPKTLCYGLHAFRVIKACAVKKYGRWYSEHRGWLVVRVIKN